LLLCLVLRVAATAQQRSAFHEVQVNEARSANLPQTGGSPSLGENAALDGLVINGSVNNEYPGVFGNRAFAAAGLNAQRERQLDEAFKSDHPTTDFPISLAINYFQRNRAEYFVPVTVRIGSSHGLTFRPGRSVMDFVAEIRGAGGAIVQRLRDEVDLTLSDDTVRDLAARPIVYDTGFSLFPGQYTIKFLAREQTTDRISTVEVAFTVPNLSREEHAIPISSVILSTQQLERRDALYSVPLMPNGQPASPLMDGDKKLIPAVTRVFSRGRSLFVYLQAYGRRPTTTEPLVAFVTFYRGETRAFETTPLRVVEAIDQSSNATPIRLSVPLMTLPAGGYNCQITVVDPVRQNVALWHDRIIVVD